jgi:hypothetical protein
MFRVLLFSGNSWRIFGSTEAEVAEQLYYLDKPGQAF